MFELSIAATALGMSLFGFDAYGITKAEQQLYFETETQCIEYSELLVGDPQTLEFVGDICTIVVEE